MRGIERAAAVAAICRSIRRGIQQAAHSGSPTSRVGATTQPRILERVVRSEDRVGVRAFLLPPQSVDGGHPTELRLQLAYRPAPHRSIRLVRDQIRDRLAIAGDREALPRATQLLQRSRGTPHRDLLRQLDQPVDDLRMRAQWRSHHIRRSRREAAVKQT